MTHILRVLESLYEHALDDACYQMLLSNMNSQLMDLDKFKSFIVRQDISLPDDREPLWINFVHEDSMAGYRDWLKEVKKQYWRQLQEVV
jgi:hypothetical protein